MTSTDPEVKRAYDAARYVANREAVKSRVAARAIEKAGEIAEQQREYRKRNKAAITAKDAAYYQANKTRLNEQNRKWAKEHPEEVSVIQRRWKDRNQPKQKEYKYRKRARLRGASFAVQFSRESIFERDGWICQICFMPVELGDESIDHIIHVSLGGIHAPENVRLAHRTCNTKRGRKD